MPTFSRYVFDYRAVFDYHFRCRRFVVDDEPNKTRVNRKHATRSRYSRTFTVTGFFFLVCRAPVLVHPRNNDIYLRKKSNFVPSDTSPLAISRARSRAGRTREKIYAAEYNLGKPTQHYVCNNRAYTCFRHARNGKFTGGKKKK